MKQKNRERGFVKYPEKKQMHERQRRKFHMCEKMTLCKKVLKETFKTKKNLKCNKFIENLGEIKLAQNKLHV